MVHKQFHCQSIFVFLHFLVIYFLLEFCFLIMANDQINQIVIIDNGAHTMKVGLHTDTIPR